MDFHQLVMVGAAKDRKDAPNLLPLSAFEQDQLCLVASVIAVNRRRYAGCDIGAVAEAPARRDVQTLGTHTAACP